MSPAQVGSLARRGCEVRPSMTLPRASPRPARRLRRILAEQRANGKEFNAAWPAAVAGATVGLDRDERLGWCMDLCPMATA